MTRTWWGCGALGARAPVVSLRPTHATRLCLGSAALGGFIAPWKIVVVVTFRALTLALFLRNGYHCVARGRRWHGEAPSERASIAAQRRVPACPARCTPRLPPRLPPSPPCHHAFICCSRRGGESHLREKGKCCAAIKTHTIAADLCACACVCVCVCVCVCGASF